MNVTPASEPIDAASPQAAKSNAIPSLDRRDLAAILLLIACVAGMFWRVLFTSDMLFFRDILDYTYPHAEFIRESCRHGQLPYWNPYLNFGEPLLANPNFLFFYPYTLFIIFLPIGFAYTLHYVLHFVVAATGTYWLARRWGQSTTAAFLAAFIFTFSGPVLSLGNFYNETACAAWIPWALLLTDRALEGRSRRPRILLTLVFALQFLAAEPFTQLATFALALAYAFWRQGTRRPLLSAVNLRLLARFMAVGGFVLSLCAIQFLPSLAFLHSSWRGSQGLPYQEITYWSLHPFSLIEMVAPDFYSASLSAPSLWTLVLSSRNQPYFISLFVGFVPLFFALAGWALSRDRRRQFAAGGALVFLLLAFGRYTPIFALAYLLFPPLALVRFPLKMLIPALLLTALLAGWGLDALRQLQNPLAEHRRRVLLPLEFLLAALVFVWLVSWVFPPLIEVPAAWVLARTNELFVGNRATGLGADDLRVAAQFFRARLQLFLPGLAGFALGGIVWLLSLARGKSWARRAIPWVALLGLAQMALVNYEANPTVPKGFYAYRPPVLASLKEAESGAYRFGTIFQNPDSPNGQLPEQQFLNFDAVPEANKLPPLAQIAFRDRLTLARGSMLLRVEAVFNHDVELSFPPRMWEFWRFALAERTDPARTDFLLGHANVKYFVSPVALSRPTLREVARVFNGSSQASYLYENLDAMPRAYVAESIVYSEDSQETLTRLSASDFGTRREVVVAAAPELAPPLAGTGSPGRVETMNRQANVVTLHADLSRPGVVVLLDRYDPNWQVTIDGRPSTILRANLLFRAVYVSAGSHEISFRFRQRGLRAGAILSLATLALLLVLYCRR